MGFGSLRQEGGGGVDVWGVEDEMLRFAPMWCWKSKALGMFVGVLAGFVIDLCTGGSNDWRLAGIGRTRMLGSI
jgi:hypothetical protein